MFKIDPTIEAAINQAAAATQVDPDMLKAFCYIESRFQVGARSKTEVGGLFQITLETWQEYRGAVPYSYLPYDQAFTAGLILKKLGKKYNNHLGLMAIAYNAGPMIANKLIGKDLNMENVKQAVISMSSYWRKKKINPNQKVDETYQYFGRASKALDMAVGKNIHEISSNLASTNVTSKIQAEMVRQSATNIVNDGFETNPKHTLIENISDSPTTQKVIKELAEVTKKTSPKKMKLAIKKLIGPKDAYEEGS